VYDDPERAKMTAKAMVPMRRFASPDEIATPVIYLASEQASFVTGESIYIDGGYLA
jgi:NAD(P)-dependent dehydrogenase (short-subunit alcohol dehydrogenase family)